LGQAKYSRSVAAGVYSVDRREDLGMDDKNKFQKEAERLVNSKSSGTHDIAMAQVLAILSVAEEFRLIRVEVQKAGGEIDTLLNKIPDIGNMLGGF
jgi:hypothetical protein